MDEMIKVAFLSIILVLVFGALVLFVVLYRKGRSDKEDYSTKITGFEVLYKQGKLSKDEYNQIRLALLKKEGVELPPELANMQSNIKPIKPTAVSERNPKEFEKSNQPEQTNQDNLLK